jgi:hypothetical protein
MMNDEPSVEQIDEALLDGWPDPGRGLSPFQCRGAVADFGPAGPGGNDGQGAQD